MKRIHLWFNKRKENRGLTMELKKGTNRFYMLDGDKEIGEVTFTEDPPTVLSINHTFVDSNYRGKGIAQQLIQAVVALAMNNQKRIKPVCSYAQALFKRNKDYAAIEYHE
ncbi:GNAT family N-acetyltransferase [Sporolactobacillus inulinus]|nr:GNAT family N-acetyltransferase [Sporolactobacillus inulinus]